MRSSRRPLDELVGEAGRLRDLGHGTRITFSPKVFLPLTMLCRDRCGYCTFAKAPARVAAPYLPLDQIVDVAHAGAELGCHEALFTLGEAPEDRYPIAREWLAAHGYGSTIDYLVGAAGAVIEETGLLPHANAGALPRDAFERLRAVCPSQGMMLETLAARLGEPGGPHHGAPDKTPERRLAALDAAGRAGVPFTTGILVGIGETRAERIDALRAIRGEPRAARTCPGSHRAELPAEARNGDAPRSTVRSRRDAVVGRRRAHRARTADARAGAAEPR